MPAVADLETAENKFKTPLDETPTEDPHRIVIGPEFNFPNGLEGREYLKGVPTLNEMHLLSDELLAYTQGADGDTSVVAQNDPKFVAELIQRAPSADKAIDDMMYSNTEVAGSAKMAFGVARPRIAALVDAFKTGRKLDERQMNEILIGVNALKLGLNLMRYAPI